MPVAFNLKRFGHGWYKQTIAAFDVNAADFAGTADNRQRGWFANAFVGKAFLYIKFVERKAGSVFVADDLCSYVVIVAFLHNGGQFKVVQQAT